MAIYIDAYVERWVDGRWFLVASTQLFKSRALYELIAATPGSIAGDRRELLLDEGCDEFTARLCKERGAECSRTISAPDFLMVLREDAEGDCVIERLCPAVYVTMFVRTLTALCDERVGASAHRVILTADE